MSAPGESFSAAETRVARCLEDYRARRLAGEHPDPKRYRSELAESFEEFLDLLAAETFFEEALAVPRELSLPRRFGRYRLERELGRGSSGVVYEAFDTETDTHVALKVMRAGFDLDVHARERFLREARACQQVQHLNIVEIHGAGECEGRPYYAMTLIRGQSLARLARGPQRLAPRALCRGLSGVTLALGSLHDRGVVHRDVKPSNIIVETNGRMVLADFGLARMDIASTLTRTGSSLGTPLYMSPEQMTGGRAEVDGRSDVYGLGATLYEGLTGRPPFEAEDYRTLVPKILGERPRAPHLVAPGVSRACSRIVLKCLEKDPRDRYADARALHADLLAFVDGRPVRGRPVSRARRALRAIARHPVRAGLAAAVLLIGALLATLWRPAPPPAYLDVRLARPTRAAIFVDGIELGIEGYEGGLAGLAAYELAPGRHTLRCRAEGYVDFVDTFEARPGQTVTYGVSLDMTPELLQEVSRRLRAGVEADTGEEGGGGG